MALAVLIAVLLVTSGPEIRQIGRPTLLGILALAIFTIAAGFLGPGSVQVRRSATMTTLVRNLSLALLAARFMPNSAAVALVILTYGLAMYLLAIGLVRRSRRADAA